MFSFLRKKEPVKAKRSGLGLDEKKHIRCKYKNKKKCPQDCAECCFSIKLKGDFMMQVQAYDSAAELYEDAVSREPDYADAWLALGNAAAFRGDLGRALEAYEEAIFIDDRFGEALYGRAVALKNLHRPKEALEAVETVMALYDYEPCQTLKKEILQMTAADEAKEAKKQEEKNRLLKQMIRLAVKKGYVQDRLPVAADVTAIADCFIPECIIRLTGQKKYTLEEVKAAAVCCFYGGAGIAQLGKRHWGDFSVQGISRGLFDPRGFACMDEYACTLMGIAYESVEGQALKRFSAELSNLVMSAIMTQIGAKKMNDRQVEAVVKDAMRDVYTVGAGIGLSR